MRKLGVFISDAAVKEGMQKTVWQGRMECLCKEPLIYMDGAHNLPAAKRLWETLESDFTNKSITYIMGVLADKEYEEMLALLLPRAGISIHTGQCQSLAGRKITKDHREFFLCGACLSFFRGCTLSGTAGGG